MAHYMIMTADGWKPLFPPMSPVPKIDPWWRSGLTGLRIRDGSDMQDTVWREWEARMTSHSIADKIIAESDNIKW